MKRPLLAIPAVAGAGFLAPAPGLLYAGSNLNHRQQQVVAAFLAPS